MLPSIPTSIPHAVPRGAVPRVVPAGWPLDVAPLEVIRADYTNAVKASVYAWPGDVDAQNHKLKNVVLENVTGAVGSFNGRTGVVVPVAGDYTAAMVTGAVPSTRQVIAGAGMSGGGDLSADRTLTANVVSVFGRTGAVVLTTADLTTAGGVPATRLISNGTGITGGGDLSANRTLAVVPDTTVQQVRISKAAALIGTRREINLIEGANVTLTVADDAANNRVNVTVAAAAGGAAQTPWTSHIDAAGFQLQKADGVKLGPGNIGQFVYGGTGECRLETIGAVKLSVYGSPLSLGAATFVSFSIVAAEKMRLAPTTGNLLIGTSVDAAADLLVQVNGKVKSLTGGFVFPDGTIQTTAFLGGGGAQTPWASTINANNFALHSALGVHIGATGPLATPTTNRKYLSLRGGSGEIGAVEFGSTIADAHAALQGVFYAVDMNSATKEQTASVLFQLDGVTAGNRGGKISIYTKADGGGMDLRLMIGQSGNVLVGTVVDTTGYKLQVNGSLLTTGLLVQGGVLILGATMPPASSTAFGYVGQLTYDNSFFYICIGANSWRRAALSSW